ncbi:hypothetical protein ACWEQC_15760, partial [Streptomyces shenzhenensis]
LAAVPGGEASGAEGRLLAPGVWRGVAAVARCLRLSARAGGARWSLGPGGVWRAVFPLRLVWLPLGRLVAVVSWLARGGGLPAALAAVAALRPWCGG